MTHPKAVLAQLLRLILLQNLGAETVGGGGEEGGVGGRGVEMEV